MWNDEICGVDRLRKGVYVLAYDLYCGQKHIIGDSDELSLLEAELVEKVEQTPGYGASCSEPESADFISSPAKRALLAVKK